MKIAVVTFPGSNCEHDVVNLYERVLGQKTVAVWHGDTDLKGADVVVLPGGFAYGDYLRTGAMAKVSPIMSEVAKFAKSGGPVLGVCNGFQILCEAGLLPGVLLQNIQMKFLSQFVHLRVDQTETPFTKKHTKGDIITCPLAHFDGNYFADTNTIKTLEDNGQVVFRYASAEGEVDPSNLETNPNGSINAIAGICNRERNVVGLMPHPDRAYEGCIGYIGGETGLKVFESCLSSCFAGA